MVARSQRPLVAKILALEPMTVGARRYDDLDSLLADMGSTVAPEVVAAAFREVGVEVSQRTLYKWRENDDN